MLCVKFAFVNIELNFIAFILVHDHAHQGGGEALKAVRSVDAKLVDGEDVVVGWVSFADRHANARDDLIIFGYVVHFVVDV